MTTKSSSALILPDFPAEMTSLENMKGPTLSDQEFKEISSLVYNVLGINLTEQKRLLVIGRLHKIIKTKGFTTYSDYINYVKSDKTQNALVELASLISTNFTSFYREAKHFDFFKATVLPWTQEKLKKEKSSDIRIWSAGCSSGQEPYTIIFSLLEFFGGTYGSYNAGVLATDISDRVLSAAQTGIYTDQEINTVPTDIKSKYFKKLDITNRSQIEQKIDGDQWLISEVIKKEVTFRHFNLMNKTFPFKKKFHTIFCRNVMIYFDQPTRETLVQKFYDNTEPGGYLFISHSESLRREACSYDYVQPGIYRKKS